MPDPMSEEAVNDMRGDALLAVVAMQTLRSHVFDLTDEVDRLRSQVHRMCGELGTAQSPPSAKEAQDALDELMEFVPHYNTCAMAQLGHVGVQPICDCLWVIAEDKLEALILRLATGNAERLAAAEKMCEYRRHLEKCDYPRTESGPCTCGHIEAYDTWQALREGANDVHAKQD